MIHVGDITKLYGWELEPVDCITGGSPCQDLSLAGKRAGLAGERSSLFMEQVRLVKEMRDATRTSALSRGRIKPRYMVWENVAGAFSSNGGKDFQAVLTEIARIAEPEAPDVPMPAKTWPHAGCLYSEVGAWSIAWRLHDAQFWGVPQRRKRISLVADFGGMSAPEILFERKGLCWDTAESGEQGKGAAGETSDSTGETSYGVTTKVLAFEPGIASREGGHCYEDKSGTLRAEPGDNAQAVCYGISSYDSNAMKSDNPHSGIYEADTSRTIDLNRGNPACNQGGMAVVGVDCYNLAETGDKAMTIRAANANAEHIPVVLESNQNHATAKETEICPALKAAGGEGGGHIPMVVQEPISIGNGQLNQIGMQSVVNTLDTMHDQQAILEPVYSINEKMGQTYVHKDQGNTLVQSDYKQPQTVMTHTVRRLTPLECERLQGFPSEKKVDVFKMTKDEYIAWNIAEKNIIVDAENGKVFGTRGPGGIPYKEPKELQGTILNGYKVVSIRNGATKLMCRVHRIIWISKHGIIPDGYVVDHINNDKQDNRISNLQLLTPEDNSHKAKEDGLYKEGLDNKATKIDPYIKDEIAFLYSYSEATMRDLAKLYGVSKSRIHQIIHEVGWTDIGEWTDSKGKIHKESSDSARYKALGNSIALPFWFYLLRRISAQYERPATLGSLFDGIGGFPLCWERCNGNGTAIWASEVDEFCIAVTKRRFPDGTPCGGEK